MAAKLAARFGTRRLFSSGTGKILSEEEKAAENAYFKVSIEKAAYVLCSCFTLFALVFILLWVHVNYLTKGWCCHC